MLPLRAFIRDHRRLAIVLVALALCMKIMVPAGFMIGTAGKSLSIAICNGRGADLTTQINLPQTGQSHEKAAEQGKAADACPFAALTMAALSGGPTALLVVALAFILARGVWPAAVAQPAQPLFLRPPLRAPPLRV
jgi:hypothetical protein